MDTKRVRVTVSAMTRMEYSTVVEVPADTSHQALEDLAEQIYQDTDGSEYADDPEYWERGSQQVLPAEDDDQPDVVKQARRENGQWVITDKKQPYP
jgi:hypothetical protein